MSVEISVDRQIQSLNCQLNNFIVELRSFRKRCNVINKSLVRSMLEAVEEISNFVDSDPKIYKDDVEDLDFSVLHYARDIQCCICQATFENNVHRHLLSGRHQQKLLEYRIRQAKFLERENEKDPDRISQQIPDDLNLQRQTQTECTPPIKLPMEIREIFQHGQSIDRFTSTKTNEINLSYYMEFVKRFKNVFNTFTVYMCGPIALGFQDLLIPQQVFIDTGNTFYDYPPRSTETIAAIINMIIYKFNLNEYGRIVKFEKDQSGRYPVLHAKFTNDPITYTLTFTNGLSYVKCQLVNFFLSADPLIYNTCIALRNLVFEHGLGSYFNAYIIALLVIHYYQKTGLLPSVSALQLSLPNDVNKIGPWQVHFEQSLPKGIKKQLAKIAPKMYVNYTKEFFEYLGSKLGLSQAKLLSPFLGPLSLTGKKFQINFVENPVMLRYHKFCATAPTTEHLQMDTAICLQDPIELNKNLTAHISPEVLQHFKSILHTTASRMSSQN